MTNSGVHTPISQSIPLPSDSLPLDLTPMSKFLAQTNVPEMPHLPYNPFMSFNQSGFANLYQNSLYPINYSNTEFTRSPASNSFPFMDGNFSFPDIDTNVPHMAYGDLTSMGTSAQVFPHLL